LVLPEFSFQSQSSLCSVLAKSHQSITHLRAKAICFPFGDGATSLDCVDGVKSASSENRIVQNQSSGPSGDATLLPVKGIIVALFTGYLESPSNFASIGDPTSFCLSGVQENPRRQQSL